MRPEHDFVLEMNEDGYLVVQGGVYVEWADQPTTGLPVFDSLGTQLAQPSPQLVRATPDEPARTCPACQAVQAGTLTAYREQRKAEGEARTAASAERKAQRARSETRAV